MIDGRAWAGEAAGKLSDRTMKPVYACFFSPPTFHPTSFLTLSIFFVFKYLSGFVHMVVAHTHADRLHVVNTHYA
jgi:hypothetical protein